MAPARLEHCAPPFPLVLATVFLPVLVCPVQDSMTSCRPSGSFHLQTLDSAGISHTHQVHVYGMYSSRSPGSGDS
jgi:hypothetical protein